jgi:prevent-host-death family protein
MKYEHIPAGQFKAHCLQLMNDINTKKVGYIITKRGVPVARILPPEETVPPQLFGWLTGTIIEENNIIDPIDVEWESMNETR